MDKAWHVFVGVEIPADIVDDMTEQYLVSGMMKFEHAVANHIRAGKGQSKRAAPKGGFGGNKVMPKEKLKRMSKKRKSNPMHIDEVNPTMITARLQQILDSAIVNPTEQGVVDDVGEMVERPQLVSQVKEVLQSLKDNQRSILPLALCKLKTSNDGAVSVEPRLGKNKHSFVAPLLDQFGQEESDLSQLLNDRKHFNCAFDASKLIMKTLQYDGYPRVQDTLDWLINENIVPLLRD